MHLTNFRLFSLSPDFVTFMELVSFVHCTLHKHIYEKALYWFVKNINQQKKLAMHQSLVKHEKWQLDYSYKTNRECIKCLDMHWFKFTTLSINWKNKFGKQECKNSREKAQQIV